MGARNGGLGSLPPSSFLLLLCFLSQPIHLHSFPPPSCSFFFYFITPPTPTTATATSTTTAK